MKKAIVTVAVLAMAVSVASATDIDVRVTDMDGNAQVNVDPGATVDYKVTAVLSDQENEGLAAIGIDLVFSGGDLEQANTPDVDPMKNFVRNAGITNPDGYGGTIIDGDLIQIGGGQNTIKNFEDPNNPEFPIGAVIIQVAWPPDGQVIVTGSLTAPQEGGEYTLEIGDLFANVIRKGETGIDFWRTDPADPGSIDDLTIIVGGGGICPDNRKIKGKFKGNDIKVTMRKYADNQEYTLQLFADGQPVTTEQVTTNKRGKVKFWFEDNQCGPVYEVGVEQCEDKVNVKRKCKE